MLSTFLSKNLVNLNNYSAKRDFVVSEAIS